MASTTQENNKDPPNVIHFSHPHPLECTRSSSSNNNLTCFGCKLSFVDGDEESYYNCRACSFCLHSVCSRMPLITKHPSHGGHDLVLLVIPSSPATKATLRCSACGNHVTGFCYHCAECSSIFFHTLCLALPLSISVTNHPHAMHLAFTPPYHFFCDLCSNNKKSNGWLYRCSMCEFDTHIGCAVDNIQPHSVQYPSFPQSTALMAKLLHGTRTSMIMRLVARQIGCGGNRAQEEQQQQQQYSDDRKSLKKRVVGIGKSKVIEMHADLELEERTPLRDQSTPLSDTHTPSHQFSEAYFSIDLAKSYSAAPAPAHDSKKEDTIIGSDNDDDSKKNLSVVPAETIVVNNSQGKQEETFGVVNYLTGNNIDNNALYNSNIIEKHQNKLNSAIFEGLGESNQRVLVKNSNESGLPKRRSIKDQTVPKSDSKRDNIISSGWRKCLPCL